MEMHRIQKVRSLPNYQVSICFDDGLEGVFDFSGWIEDGGVFEQLRDESKFAQVEVGENGRYIVWPGEIDVCADAICEELKSRVG